MGNGASSQGGLPAYDKRDIRSSVEEEQHDWQPEQAVASRPETLLLQSTRKSYMHNAFIVMCFIVSQDSGTERVNWCNTRFSLLLWQCSGAVILSLVTEINVSAFRLISHLLCHFNTSDSTISFHAFIVFCFEVGNVMNSTSPNFDTVN